MKFLSFFFLFFSSSLIFSQEVDPGFNSVIAQSGLKLRDAPVLNSKVISIIPYHGRVVYLDEQLYGCDTIGLLSDFPGRVYLKNGNRKVYKNRPIVGNWAHVRYQGKEGYVYNPYLGPDVNQVRKQDFFLISPGENCGDQFYELDKFHTYGIFKNGRKSWTEAVDASYVVQMEGIGFLAPILTTNKNKYLQYVIGSRKAMTPALQDWSIFRPYSLVSIEGIDTNQPEVLVVDSIVTYRTRKRVLKEAFFFDRNTGKKQKIDKAGYGHDYKVIGKGDLDGDGQPDILIEFRNKMFTRRLYLSTLAAKGDFYGLAAEENFGPCC